jgi:hypothetical protein
VSDIRPPTSAIQKVIGAAACLLCAAGTAHAQDIGPTSFRDSLVMRQIAFRAPCPIPVPKAWSLVDRTLAYGARCSMVEMAARAIAQFHRLRAPLPGPADPWNPLCVRIVVGRNTGSTGLPGDWLVIFDLAVDNPAYVVIDRQSGDVGAVMVGRGPPGDVPNCAGKD